MTHSASSIRAVIFDMDGTLVLTNGMHFDAYQKVFDRYGIKADYDDFVNNLIGIGAYNVIKTIFERNGIKVDYEELAAIKAELFNQMLIHDGPKVVDGLFEFMELLDNLGIKKAVASAANKESIFAVLRSINLYDRLPVVVSCEEVSRPKPAPDVFIEAAKQLNVAPKNCMVVEDTAHGILAACSAKMTATGILTTQSAARLREAGANFLCRDYFEISRLFEN